LFVVVELQLVTDNSKVRSVVYRFVVLDAFVDVLDRFFLVDGLVFGRVESELVDVCGDDGGVIAYDLNEQALDGPLLRFIEQLLSIRCSHYRSIIDTCGTRTEKKRMRT